ncbi:MAG: tRNA pseudouridine(55) synthase TruB [Pseudomonadota bacterium]
MARRKKGRPVNGWLVLDKPTGMTSTQAVNVVKRLFDARKAGHAGTLDPLATGVLPIALGEATKTVNYAVESDKGYLFTIRWGAETTTDDSEGDATKTSSARPSEAEVAAALPAFIGEISQVPPQFSAIKIDGQRAYDLARDGETVALQARSVFVDGLTIVETPNADHTVIEASCGKGTYVRAIARDLGRALGCYGHVTALRRTRVGAFSEAEAVPLGDIRDVAEATAETGDPATVVARHYLQPVASVLRQLVEMPVTDNDAGRIRSGQSVLMRGRHAPIVKGEAFATSKGELVALGEVEKGAFIPTRVFNL